ALGDPRYSDVLTPMVRAVGTKGHEEAVEPLVALSKGAAYVDHEFLRTELVVSLARIATTRSRREAVTLWSGFRDNGIRRDLREQLSNLLDQQRLASRDPNEIVSIDALLAELR